MPTGCNLDHMTANDRRAEIASILATGVLRAVRESRRGGSADANDSAETGASGLDLCAHSPLSVAARPAGSRVASCVVGHG